MSARANSTNSLRAAIIPLGSCQTISGILHPIFQLKKNTEGMGRVQQRFTKLIRGLMNMIYKKNVEEMWFAQLRRGRAQQRPYDSIPVANRQMQNR